jgi:hypothetical protein
VKNGALQAEAGYVDSQPPRERAFARELDAELDRMRTFLGLQNARSHVRLKPDTTYEYDSSTCVKP